MKADSYTVFVMCSTIPLFFDSPDVKRTQFEVLINHLVASLEDDCSSREIALIRRQVVEISGMGWDSLSVFETVYRLCFAAKDGCCREIDGRICLASDDSGDQALTTFFC